MTQEIFLLNTFFAYFFSMGEYLLPLFGLALLVVLFAGIVKKFLTRY